MNEAAEPAAVLSRPGSAVEDAGGDGGDAVSGWERSVSQSEDGTASGRSTSPLLGAALDGLARTELSFAASRTHRASLLRAHKPRLDLSALTLPPLPDGEEVLELPGDADPWAVYRKAVRSAQVRAGAGAPSMELPPLNTAVGWRPERNRERESGPLRLQGKAPVGVMR